MTSLRVAIAHDYLTQRGGGERVVLSMLRAFPDAVVYTSLYDPEGTFPEFRDANIVTSDLNQITWLRRNHRLALPFLAGAAERLRIEADVTVVSSSGWAHGFDIPGPKLVYCHTPARWLYLPEDYLGGASYRSPQGIALLAMRRRLRAWDQAAARTADHYFANSNVVRDRIQGVYGIDAELLHPPHGVTSDAPCEAVAELAPWPDFHLLVSRLLPYKHVDRAIEAFAGTDERLVIVGRGPEEARLRAMAPNNVQLLSGISDDQLRWLYANARALVAPSHEDFGLTPIEAAAFGTPTIALRGGGYLDTVREGATGVFFDAPTPTAIREAVRRAAGVSWDRETICAHSERFSETQFIQTLRKRVQELARTSAREPMPV